MTNFIWNFPLHRTTAAQLKANQVQDDVNHHKIQIDHLEFHLDRMALASQAMWELLKERVGVTEPELLAKIMEIDLRDGVQDKRMTPQMTTCQSCGRKLSTRSDWCIYCGTAVGKPHIFQ